MTETNELVVVKPANIPALFVKDGCDSLLKRIKEEVGKFEGDIATAKGRKEIASMAMKVAKSKVYLEGLGKDLVTGIKEQAKVIDAERKKVRDELDLLKEEVRKPLTDWEDAEKKRVADIEERITNINNHPETAFNDPSIREITSSHVAAALQELKDVVIDDSFEEFELAATKAKEAALMHLEARFIVLQNAEKEQAEAERLEKERLEKEQKEREEKIAKDAAEAAIKETEEKAQKEQEEKDRLAREAIEKAERETLEAKLETERVEREKREAAEQADRDRDQAVEDEKKRQADQIKADEKAEEKRQANKRHCGKINREAKASFVGEGYNEEEAEKIVKLIASNKIKNATINY